MEYIIFFIILIISIIISYKQGFRDCKKQLAKVEKNISRREDITKKINQEFSGKVDELLDSINKQIDQAKKSKKS